MVKFPEDEIVEKYYMGLIDFETAQIKLMKIIEELQGEVK